jgi:UDP-2-acetamido-3-amino-2,3-dideoxy-glucuronate N-acetyltransferase
MSHVDAPGLVLSPDATVGAGVRFGAHVVVYAGVEIGDDVSIQDGAILGKPPTLSPRSSTNAAVDVPLRIGAGATICTQAIVFAGASIGANTIVGDQAYVRERVRIGADTVIGRGASVDNDVVIGDRVRVQSHVYLTGYSVVEDDVFIGPCAMTTNDDTMARHRAEPDLRGPILRRACRIGGGAVLVPGVEIGEEAFVAAGAVVTNDVPAFSVVMGMPARVVRRVPDEDHLERWQ